ncbi:hypothetical protein [Planotetraspora sp. GP83]|uniref:hypothetical protein n=1 Tax=Planotetraspora sp. GP83 TaxID=3156264 RepID=UPI00351293BF
MAGAVLIVTACGPSYDEAAMRTEIEKDFSHRVTDSDWATWLKLSGDLCDSADYDFEVTVGTFQVTDHINRLRIMVRNLCPERSGQLERVAREAEAGG